MSNTSYVGWLDFTDADRERALQVIAALGEHDTVDELGLGGIRDALSDEMFPGTSVLHTRARYHFFIPWLYLALERKRVPSMEIKQKARNAELDLAEVLCDAPDNEGVIGVLAGRKLKRLPSELYWQGQHVWGIRKYPGSRESYHRSLDRFYELRGGRQPRESEEAGDPPLTNWDPNLPPPPAGFPKTAILSLTRDEAAYLKERIIIAAPTSYFRYLVEARDLDEAMAFPWDYHGLSALPAGVRETVEHAQRFSKIMHGAALLYNLILAELSPVPDDVEFFLERLTEWSMSVHAERDAFSKWELQAFWSRVARSNARVSDFTRSFVQQWVKHALSDGNVAGSRQAREAIKARERRVKGVQARVDGGRPLERWSGEAGLRQLTYRWANVQRILRDIRAAA